MRPRPFRIGTPFCEVSREILAVDHGAAAAKTLDPALR